MADKDGGIERRKFRRRPVIDTFAFFAVIPKKGPQRLKIGDVSDEGIGFELDASTEEAGLFPVSAGETIHLNFYLNQSLFLPLAVKAVHIKTEDGIRRVGAKFVEKDTRSFKAFTAFLRMFDEILDVVRIDPQAQPDIKGA